MHFSFEFIYLLSGKYYSFYGLAYNITVVHVVTLFKCVFFNLKKVKFTLLDSNIWEVGFTTPLSSLFLQRIKLRLRCEWSAMNIQTNEVLHAIQHCVTIPLVATGTFPLCLKRAPYIPMAVAYSGSMDSWCYQPCIIDGQNNFSHNPLKI